MPGRRRLAELRVAVVGLEGPGAHLASALAACGVGELVLVDPYPCRPGNLALMPPLRPDALGRPREVALRDALEAPARPTRVVASGLRAVTSDDLGRLAPRCDLLVGCFDRGLSAAGAWLNTAALAHRVPALYAELEGSVALLGPLVVPGETACWACWRTRRLACEKDAGEAVAFQAHLVGQDGPALHERAVLPALPAIAGAMLAVEAVKHLLALDAPTLDGSVRELDALQGTVETHKVLPVPGCPSCDGGGPAPGPPPTMAELVDDSRRVGDPLSAATALVSRRCGVATNLALLPRHPREPALTYSSTAELAGLTARDGPRLCSGKGTTAAEARRSALGELVERYSAERWNAGDVIHARRDQLAGPSLDPHDLVLYRPEQYAALPYAPYADSTAMGWVMTRSLVTGATVHVPAIAVLLGYEPASSQERLCPTTTNGLAAGGSLTAAVLAATLEVLERDAFLVTWLNRLPSRQVDPGTHPDAMLGDLCDAYRRRGVELQLHRLAADHPAHVFLAVARQRRGDGPAATIGLGADLDPATAARGAVLEAAQLRPILRLAIEVPESRQRIEWLAADPSRVVRPDDHALLYADERAAHAFSFLEASPHGAVDWSDAGPAGTSRRLRRLVAHFRAAGVDLLYRGLTPTDMASLGLRTARVVVPGFQPVHFGSTEPRLGGTRLYELPRRLGLRSSATTPGQLNPDPHPLA